MRPIVLRGKLVSLGVPLRDDLHKAWLWNNDREVRRYLSKPAEVFFPEDELEWYEAIRKGKKREKVFAIVENSSHSLVGFVGLHKVNPSDGHAELGYFLAREFWGHGYASEAVKLALQYAFEWLNLRKVYARVYEPNVASIRVLEKNGFELAGRLRETPSRPGTRLRGRADLREVPGG